MLKNQPGPVGHVFWQITLSVLVGVLAVIAVLIYAGKPRAQALSNSLTSQANASQTGDGSPFSSFALLPPLTQRMNLLLMGVDSNGPDTPRFLSTRSDTMILLSLDPVSKKAGMLSIPRDTKVEIANGRGTNKINAAHALGGPDLAVATVKENLNLPIDHYVVVDTEGLKKLFEQLGPVEILVEKSMHYRDHAAKLNIDLEPGLQMLTPVQAEEYVRFRHDPKGDIGRVERQQWFLRQIAKKLKEPQILFKLPQLLQFAHDYVVTDLSVEDMARLISFVNEVKLNKVETAMLPGTPATIKGCSYWVADLDSSRLIADRLLGTYSYTAPAYDLYQPAQAASLTSSGPKPFSVIIRYQRGNQEMADRLERVLQDAGFRVKWKQVAEASECQHEQIIQMSARADEQTTELLKKSAPDTSAWPIVLAVETRPAADFTLVLTPSTSIKDPSLPISSNAQQVDQNLVR